MISCCQPGDEKLWNAQKLSWEGGQGQEEEEEEEEGAGQGRRGKKRRQKIHKTKAVVDDSKHCEYKLIMILFHLIFTHSVGSAHSVICRCRIIN